MLLTAETRWFWRETCPLPVERWFREGPTPSRVTPGGGFGERADRYYHQKGNVEIGVKARDVQAGRPDQVEIKGLVAVLSRSDLPDGREAVPSDQIQIWGKWKAPPLSADSWVVVHKRRWMRAYRRAGERVEELPLDANGQATEWPAVGCNLELTRVDLDGHAGSWWTLGFEAFGDLRSAPGALVAIFAFLVASGPLPPLDGERLSYPEWLDRL